MCLPVVAAVATFAMGALQSISQYQSQSQAAANQNAAAAASEQAYQEQRRLNQEAANRAYEQSQLKLKGEMAQASQKAEELLTQRLQAQGLALASGRSGQSMNALLADAQRVEGRDLGALGMNLAYAQQDYAYGIEGIYNQQASSNAQAASQRLPFTSGPDGSQLALGIGMSALGALGTYASLKAPAAGGGGGGGGGGSGGSGSIFDPSGIGASGGLKGFGIKGKI